MAEGVNYILSAQKIRRIMTERGLTQQEVARRMAPPGRKARPEVLSRLIARDATPRRVRPRTIKRLMSALGAKEPNEICVKSDRAAVPRKPLKAKNAPKKRKSLQDSLVFDFNANYTLDQLIEMQGAKPLTKADLDAIAGKWPGGMDDGFEEEIRRMRQSEIPKRRRRP